MNGAYQVNASGGTDYGPFTADVLVNPSPRLTVDVHRLLFAGIVAQGRVAATAAGPFAGNLKFAGQGLTGTVALGRAGQVPARRRGRAGVQRHGSRHR